MNSEIDLEFTQYLERRIKLQAMNLMRWEKGGLKAGDYFWEVADADMNEIVGVFNGWMATPRKSPLEWIKKEIKELKTHLSSMLEPKKNEMDKPWSNHENIRSAKDDLLTLVTLKYDLQMSERVDALVSEPGQEESKVE